MIKYIGLSILAGHIIYAASGVVDASKIPYSCCIDAMFRYSSWEGMQTLAQSGELSLLNSSIGRLHQQLEQGCFKAADARQAVESLGRRIAHEVFAKEEIVQAWSEANRLLAMNFCPVGESVQHYRDLCDGQIQDALASKIPGLSFHSNVGVAQRIKSNAHLVLSQEQKKYYLAAQFALELCCSALPKFYACRIYCDLCRPSCMSVHPESKLQKWLESDRALKGQPVQTHAIPITKARDVQTVRQTPRIRALMQEFGEY